MRIPVLIVFIAGLVVGAGCINNTNTSDPVRRTELFMQNWKFIPGDHPDANQIAFDDSGWRELDLPHDWSIEGMFSKDHAATPGGGALPGGIGWYRKTFSLPTEANDMLTFIEFDGVYQGSEVWINGHYLGKRPNGYISFRYELTRHLHLDGSPNLLAVRVDNSQQPNSRWYSGSGIYREVRLVTCNPLHVDYHGTFVSTPEVDSEHAIVSVQTMVRNDLGQATGAELRSIVLDPEGRIVSEGSLELKLPAGMLVKAEQQLEVEKPLLWSPDHPVLYTLLTEISREGVLVDQFTTPFGIRYFKFDAETGFSLNGSSMKINGVCMHHDLGALGAAAYPRAIERQLGLLKDMGCNAIRCSHNPPAPVFLDLCDRMGFLVMDETFDMWKKKKTEYDYHLYWDEWHERDLSDHIIRDRNHPSVIIWSIGNEILEQWDDSGEEMAIALANLVRELDPTRPITSGCNEPSVTNSINRSGALDLIGYNYHLENFSDVPDDYPGVPFIATETTSAFATRGYYDQPSDSLRIWPIRWDFPSPDMNPGHTCSAYDNCHAPWGSTHEAALLQMKYNDFVSGMFVWTGFDYLGEPTPYGWPSRSSYFGILDLAGFPKDAYYLYQSEWTSQAVLHLFPHWNWNIGDTIDLWAYSNCPEVELFLNGTSLGIKKKEEGSLHVQWRVPYVPGTLEAKGVYEGRDLVSQVATTGEAFGIHLVPDRSRIAADPLDLAFVRVEIVDEQGRIVPEAANEIRFSVEGEGELIAVDNGLQTSMEPFKAPQRRTFNGLCLAIIKSSGEAGEIQLSAESDGLVSASIEIVVK